MSNQQANNKPEALQRELDELVVFDARNVPISTRFDDPYYSFENGLAESEYVFLKGNDLKTRLKSGFHIAELGFGTGLNFLLTWRLWRTLGREGQIRFSSFEAFPLSAETREKSLVHFPELAKLFEEFAARFDGENFENDEIHLRVIHGDARTVLPLWDGRAEAWFLDGFSPAKNPDLWDAELMKSVYEHTAPQGHFATYSAAGFVRRNLQEAGFRVERIAGYGHKRHMTIGRRED